MFVEIIRLVRIDLFVMYSNEGFRMLEVGEDMVVIILIFFYFLRREIFLVIYYKYFMLQGCFFLGGEVRKKQEMDMWCGSVFEDIGKFGGL